MLNGEEHTLFIGSNMDEPGGGVPYARWNKSEKGKHGVNLYVEYFKKYNKPVAKTKKQADPQI